MRRIRTAIIGAAALCAAAILPAAATADCTLTTSNNGGNTDYLSGGTTQTFTGHFAPALNGKFVQIPFDVGSGITGMKIRYCFARPTGAESDDSPTLDLGVYEALPLDATTWSQAQRRGWSGSALRTIGIGGNGYSPASEYDQAGGSQRKYYTPGYTTRAFKPGPIGAGKWAVELGAGWIDPDGAGVDWKVQIATSTAPEWNDDAFAADPYTPYVANPNAGWYSGDLHAHGEMEPGNATMVQTATAGFKPLSEGGSGLDFMTIVDHNNDNARSILGGSAYDFPGKLIIPGVEVTTYNGHTNTQGSSNFADFRMGDVYRWDDANDDDTQDGSELTSVRGPIDPSSQFQQILEGGGWTQINHPTIYENSPSLCRGCLWNYTDQQTDFSKVSAIELQSGPAGLPSNNPVAMNSYTATAIQFYEHALSTGAHIAAVGVSDDHQGATVPTNPVDKAVYSPVGRGATVVHADQLSTQGIIGAVKAGHTYVKPFGADAPNVEMKAGEPGKADLAAIPGDSVVGPSMNIQIHVTGAGPSAVRPGPYTLAVLQDGIQIDSVQVTSDSFDHNLNVKETGRYSFELTRPLGSTTAVEAYSTPVWFTYKAPIVPKPSNAFSFGAFKPNRAKGTATLKVKVASPGTVRLTGAGLVNSAARAKAKNQTVTLNLRPNASLKKKLKRTGSARVTVRVTNLPTGGKALTKPKTVKLLGKKAKKKRR